MAVLRSRFWAKSIIRQTRFCAVHVCIYIIMIAYIEYARFQPYGCGRKKKLRIFGVEIFGVEIWSA